MPRKNKQNLSAIGVGLTAKQMKRRKPIGSEMMREIEPLTENQKKLLKEQYGVCSQKIDLGDQC